MRDLNILEDGAVSMRDGEIVWVGPTDQLPHKSGPTFDASGKVVLPGFVDSHTHAVFAASRANEFEWRIKGDSHTDIFARGGRSLSSRKPAREDAALAVRGAGRLLESGP